MISISVNNQTFLVKSTLNLIEACKYTGFILPRFCYHEKLSIAANCRMCLVEIGGMGKPVTACSHAIISNLNVFTNTPFVKKARENILEILLLNHPLDCPICDQGGECDLQDQVKVFGNFYSRFYLSNKRKVKNKKCSPLIKTIMTRCIHCTRCVRFSSEVAGVEALGTLNRGVSTEIGGYVSKLLDSEVSGNVIDLCPVGALTNRTYHFNIRPWELKTVKSIDTLDSLGTHAYFQIKKTKIIRVLPMTNVDLNENWISDKTRFSTDSLNSKNKIKNLKVVDQNTDVEFFMKNLFKIKDLSNSKLNLTNKNSTLNVYDNVQSLLKSNKNIDLPGISFFINENADFQLIFLLNNFKKINRNINVFSTDYRKFLNFDFSWKFNKVKLLQNDIKNCFLFTSNIRVENVLLHLRLNTKFLNKNFNVLQFNVPNKAKFPTSVINLNIKNTINFFEGKEFFSSNALLSSFGIFLFGASFTNRCSISFLNFLSFLNMNFPTAIILKPDGNSNTSSFSSLGIKYYNSKKTNLSSIFFYNKLENLNIRTKTLVNKSSNGIKKNIFSFWFNSHENNNLFLNSYENKYLNSRKENKNFYIVPTATSLEEKGIYLNLEERPQETQIVKNLTYNSVCLKQLITKTLLLNNGYLVQNIISKSINNYIVSIKKFEFISEINFILELLNNFKLFNTVQKNFTFLFISKIASSIVYGKCLKYPVKLKNENFYTSTNYLKNSINMENYQKKINKLFDNF
jgi:hypothetical protein